MTNAFAKGFRKITFGSVAMACTTAAVFFDKMDGGEYGLAVGGIVAAVTATNAAVHFAQK